MPFQTLETWSIVSLFLATHPYGRVSKFASHLGFNSMTRAHPLLVELCNQPICTGIVEPTLTGKGDLSRPIDCRPFLEPSLSKKTRSNDAIRISAANKKRGKYDAIESSPTMDTRNGKRYGAPAALHGSTVHLDTNGSNLV